MSRPPLRVVHLTSAHRPWDIRIFTKECRTLAASGFEVVLVVPHERDECADGVRIRAVRPSRGRLHRMTVTTLRIARAALAEHADLYHFHDPELIPIGLWLRLLGKRVVYDVHEAYAEKLRTRDYLPRVLRGVVAWIVGATHRGLGRVFNGIITADTFVASQMNGRVLVLANVPRLDLFPPPGPKPVGALVVAYAGDLTRERGLLVLLAALEQLPDLPLRIECFGHLEHPQDAELLSRDGRITVHGFRPHQEVVRFLAQAHVGLVLFERVPAYVYARENTTKLFEYMAAGCAVLASDFPGLRSLVVDTACGLCVDPDDPTAIAAALRELATNATRRESMGARGRALVLERWNWDHEGARLVAFYGELLGAGV